MTAKSSVTADNWSGVTYDAYNDGSSDATKRNDGVFDIDGYKCSLDTLNLYGDDVTHYKNAKGKNCVRIKIDNPIATGDITTHTAEKAYEKKHPEYIVIKNKVEKLTEQKETLEKEIMRRENFVKIL